MTIAHQRAQTAILLACTAYALYSCGDAILKHIGEAVPVGVIMTIGGSVIVTLSLIALATRGQIDRIWTTPKRRLHLIRACIVGALACLATYALRTVPLPDFYGILFMSPFLIGLFAHFYMGERINPVRLSATIIGFIGVIILAGPHFDHMNVGYILVFIQLFGVAAHVICVRKLGTGDPWPLLTFFPGLGILAVGLVQLAIHPVWPDPVWVPLIVMYGCMIFLGQICFSRAYTTTPLLAIIAPYLYTQMLWGVLFGVFIFNQMPPSTTWIGAGLIIIGGMVSLGYERHLRRVHLRGLRAVEGV